MQEKITPDPLSICFVSQEYPEETGWGGIGTYTYEMAHGLARAGHRAVIVSRALDHPQHYFEADGVEVYRVLPSLSLDSAPLLWRLNRYWEGYRLAVALKLREMLRERQIDVIETPELHAETLLHTLAHTKPPLVVRLHSGSAVVMNFEPNQEADGKLNARLENWVVKKAARVTSPSKALLNKNRLSEESGRFTVIPNPVDIDHFKPAQQSQDPGAFPNIICVGRPRTLKGIHVLAQAMPQIWQAIPEARFTFVPASMGKGGGSPADSYREILGSLLEDYRVQVIASASRNELPEIYRNATLCVVPSLWEGFGYVCAEAMACGLPVIASRAGGLQEIVVEGQSGVLVEPSDAPELARAVIELLRDCERRRSLGLVARKRIVEQFSSAAIATRMANFYREVVQEAAN